MTHTFKNFSELPWWHKAVVLTFGRRETTKDRAGSLEYIVFNGVFYITEERV